MGNCSSNKNRSNNHSASLSCGVESLFAQLPQKPTEIYDYIIVGSGYGGSIAADHLSAGITKDNKLKICVLERGREFLPGAFPNSLDEAPTEVRLVTPNATNADGNAEGLYDLRLGDDLNVLQANGLGGGSLINAGVMERPNSNVFDAKRWGGITDLENKLDTAYNTVEKKLGVVIDGEKNTILRHSGVVNHGSSVSKLKKLESIKALQSGSSRARFKTPSLSISMSNDENSVGQLLNQCRLCGNCASGCNFGAKNSLDENLLVRAERQGCEIYTGASVLSFARVNEDDEAYWLINVAYTDTVLRARQVEKSYQVKTKNLIISAGSLGSTELLLRSRNRQLRFSNTLGERFSSNGDMIFVGYGQNQEANAIAKDLVPEPGHEIGPTITGMIEYYDDAISDIPIVFQEMAVPASLQFVFSEIYTTAMSIRSLMKYDWSAHKPGQIDDAQVSQDTLRNTSLYAAMGADQARGKLALSSNAEYAEGTIQVRWKSLRNSPLLHAQEQALKEMSDNSGVGGEVIQNPIWKLMPDDLMFLLDNKKGPPLTVHPLGGCPIGVDAQHGVCDEFGRVFDAANSDSHAHHPGLFVLDGALIPRALGINPALTIAALSQRAVEQISAVNKENKNKRQPTPQRPFLRPPENTQTVDTLIELTERLTGFSTLPSDTGDTRDVVIELTLWTLEKRVKDLTQRKNNNAVASDQHQFKIDTDNTDPITKYPTSLLRIYYLEDWQALRDQDPRVEMSEQRLSAITQYEGTVEGVISVLECRKTWAIGRFVRGVLAWLPNRGLRDIDQWLSPKPWETSAGSPLNWRTFASFLHAGAERVLRYDINVNTVLKQTDFARLALPDNNDRQENSDSGYAIIGEKNLCYRRASNPWQQLSSVRLKKFPSKRDADMPTLRRVKNFLFSSVITIGKFFFSMYKDGRYILLGLVTFILAALSTLLFSKSAWLLFGTVVLLAIVAVTALTYRVRRHRDKHNFGKIWLNLDTNYLAKIGIPLINITQQQNQVQALTDIGALITYVARIIFGIHFYSFRKPDASKPRKIDRRSHSVPGLPNATIHKISVGIIPKTEVPELPAGTPVHIEITEYSHAIKTPRRPILLLHGYSSSTTSFAHSSLPNSLAKHFFDEGRDVWMLDMRTSSALASARHPWKFEESAEVDIPLALSFVAKKYSTKIDVFAHCMGGAMLGMAILQESEKDPDANYQCWQEEFADPNFYKARINRIAFSQATPTPRFTPDNNFRAFITSHIKELIPNNYQFLPGANEPIYSDLLDRLLYSLPYPIKDYYRTNPRGFFKRKLRTSFALTRHRMDALYGQTFEANNLNDNTLKHIDDIFGPLHVDTVLQAGYFANKGVITNAKGQNIYVSKDKLKTRWSSFPTFSLHSKYNGLLDYSTGKRTQRIFQEADIDYETELIEHQRYGHQDSLLADSAHVDIFPHFSRFFDTEIAPAESDASADKNLDSSTVKVKQTWIIEPPKYGPVIIGQDHQHNTHGLKLLFGLDNARAARPTFYALVPVVKRGTRFELDLAEGESWQDYVDNTIEIKPKLVCEDSDLDWLCLIINQSRLEALTRAQHDDELERGALILVGYLDLVAMSDGVATIEHESTYKGIPHVVVKKELSPQAYNEELYHKATSHKPSRLDNGESKPAKSNLNTLSRSGREAYDENNYDLDQVLNCFFESDANQTTIFSEGLLASSALKRATQQAHETSGSQRQPLTFAVGSCQYPAGMFDSVVAFRSYKDLAHVLRHGATQRKPDFIALVGDQIYADATAGVLDSGDKFDRYTTQYLNLYGNKHVRSALRQLPMYAMLDDHEIRDNYQPENVVDDSVHEGIRTFLSFQRGEKYRRPEGGGSSEKTGSSLAEQQFWYSFVQNGYDFFMLDTRTQRSSRHFNDVLSSDTTIIGTEQQLALETWLKQRSNDDAPKFIISASMLLPRHRIQHAGDVTNLIRSDSWDGYPSSLHHLLGLVHELNIKNLVFLSGDEHMNCYCKIELNAHKTEPTIVRSIHCSGLYTPFPFANAREEKLMGEITTDGIKDEFSFNYQGETEQEITCLTHSSTNIDDINFDKDSPVIVEPCISPYQGERKGSDGNGFTLVSVRDFETRKKA